MGFDEKVSFYINDRQQPFPADLIHKEEFFQAGRIVYNSIAPDALLTEIKITTEILDCGETVPVVSDQEVRITVKIAAKELGIINDGYIIAFEPSQCKKFADVLAHELFHAQSIAQCVNRYGVQNFRDILQPSDPWIKKAWIAFDEYYACRKNAEEYGSFDSVELKKIDRFDSLMRAMLTGPQSQQDLYISAILYLLATISAFSDVDKNRAKEIEQLLPSPYAKFTLAYCRQVFNATYSELPLDANAYKKLGDSLKKLLLLSISD